MRRRWLRRRQRERGSPRRREPDEGARGRRSGSGAERERRRPRTSNGRAIPCGTARAAPAAREAANASRSCESLARWDERAQRLERPELDPAHGPLALPDEVRDLEGAVSLDEAQDDDLLLEWSELRERSAHGLLVGEREDRRVRLDDLVDTRMRERVFERDLNSGATGAVDDRVPCDAVEPGKECHPRLVARDRPERTHEHVAHEILGICVVPYPVEHVSVHGLDVAVVERSEGGRVPLSGA